MKNKKWLVICVAVIVLAGCWFWRYTTMNAYYDSLDNTIEILRQTGEIVPFGQNKTNEGNVIEGYSIRVDDMEILEFKDFLQTWKIDPEELNSSPDRVVLVYITLFNEDSDESVDLPELQFHGPDNSVGMNWDILWALNPELDGYTGIRLSHGQEYQVVLPYSLYRRFFGFYTWNNLDDYGWLLRITSWPEQIDIAVTPNE